MEDAGSIDEKVRIFEALYDGLAGYQLSHKDRAALEKTGDKSHVYGEILPRPFEELLTATGAKAGQTFFDLGSGLGKPVILASMLVDFAKCLGIEMLPTLVESSRSVLARYDDEFRSQLPGKADQQIEFRQGDILEVDLSEPDVVFIHGTCFSPELHEPLTRKLVEELKPGAVVMGLGMPFVSESLFIFHVVPQFSLDWGLAPACLYRKV